MRNGEQKPARNPGEDARPLLGDLLAQHPEAATAASRLGHDLAFLYGLSFLDFLRWISSSWIPARWIWGNSGDLQQQKGARKKKMSKWFGMISLWPLDSTTVVFIACYAVLCERRRKNMYAYQ